MMYQDSNLVPRRFSLSRRSWASASGARSRRDAQTSDRCHEKCIANLIVNECESKVVVSSTRAFIYCIHTHTLIVKLNFLSQFLLRTPKSLKIENIAKVVAKLGRKITKFRRVACYLKPSPFSFRWDQTYFLYVPWFNFQTWPENRDTPICLVLFQSKNISQLTDMFPGSCVNIWKGLQIAQRWMRKYSFF